MQEKDLRKLSRKDLLELLIEQTRRADDLEARLTDALARLEERQILMERCGTLAEASMALNGLFEAADKAAAQYLENVQTQVAQQRQACEDACRERESNCDRYEQAMNQRLQKLYDEHPELVRE